MCLIAFSYRQHKRYKYILVANRDEFYARPTSPMNWWEDIPYVIAGRDLKAGGTWQGMNKNGRWAALTNYREPDNILPDAPSRGDLVSNFIANTHSSKEYLQVLSKEIQAYNGFNLLVDDGENLGYISNRAQSFQILEPGLYGLSNHLLNTPWPKVEKLKSKLANFISLPEKSINPESLFSILHDTQEAPENQLPNTGVSLKWEKILSPMFIQSEVYGTRVSTVMLIDYEGRVVFSEKDHKSQKINTFTFNMEEETRNTSTLT